MIKIIDDYDNSLVGVLLLKPGHILLADEYEELERALKEVKGDRYADMIAILETYDFVDEFIDVTDIPTLYF